MKIYGDGQSGNCYKIQLVCALLDIDHEWIEMDIVAGETGKPWFLEKSPVGKIPLLELADGRTLSESNAIVNFLARDSNLLPKDAFDLAKVQQWQFFEQYSHEPFIAVARYIAKYLGLPEDRRAEYEGKQEGGYKALSIMEEQLGKTPYIIGEVLTTADIALYAYTHVAHEGGFALSRYPAVESWCQRISLHPRYTEMH